MSLANEMRRSAEHIASARIARETVYGGGHIGDAYLKQYNSVASMRAVDAYGRDVAAVKALRAQSLGAAAVELDAIRQKHPDQFVAGCKQSVAGVVYAHFDT